MYLNENIVYDKALSYLTAASTLNNINDELDRYKQKIKEFNESRRIYEEATENQQVKDIMKP